MERRDQPNSRRASSTASWALTWHTSRQYRSSRPALASRSSESSLAAWTAPAASSKGRAAVRVPNCTSKLGVDRLSRGTSRASQGARAARWDASFSPWARRAFTCRSSASTPATAWSWRAAAWGEHSSSLEVWGLGVRSPLPLAP